jgi:NAD(P)H-dependent flavin oxidoreductase YrpB (nitropropane dioxygenase family)
MPLPPVLRNLPLPIIGAPLFIVSNPKLVIAQCKAGVVGSMPALNARPAEQLDEWLAEITEALAAHDPRASDGAPRRSRSTRSSTRATTGSARPRRARSTRCRSSSPRSARAPT